MSILRRRLAGTAAALLCLAAGEEAAAGALPGDTPARFTPKTDAFDYVKREEMVAMRDGVKLKTFILVPKGATRAPILLTRTPYNASGRATRFHSPHLAAAVPQMHDTAAAAGFCGYQQMLSADILRGRYREDPSKPQPIEPDKVLPYRIQLPNVSHTFLPGHRIMVQIQSTWFPLYDRNPQTYVPNIMFAKPADFVKATQRIWHTPDAASVIELPVIAATRAR